MQSCANSIANALELPQSSFSHWQMYESSIIHWYHSYCCLSQSLDEIAQIYNLVFSTGFSWLSMFEFWLYATVSSWGFNWWDVSISSVKPSVTCHIPISSVNSSPPEQNGCHFANNIFLTENGKILIQFSLKFVPKSPIGNKSTLVQVMACRLFGAKPLPEPMLTQFTDAYMWHEGEMS